MCIWRFVQPTSHGSAIIRWVSQSNPVPPFDTYIPKSGMRCMQAKGAKIKDSDRGIQLFLKFDLLRLQCFFEHLQRVGTNAVQAGDIRLAPLGQIFQARNSGRCQCALGRSGQVWQRRDRFQCGALIMLASISDSLTMDSEAPASIFSASIASRSATLWKTE